MKTTRYIPKHLERWTLPNSYFGAEWPDYYVFLGRNRDSDCLANSNFECALKEIGGKSEENGVYVVREGHWACGWIEWIAIHQDNAAALEIADKITEKLEGYPVLDEDHFSELEREEADIIWRDCCSVRERIKYMRDYHSQFEWCSFSDLLAQARGRYFGGYAWELIN
jgi:hypothetical protein